MTTQEKMARLIDRLRARTASGDVIWEPTLQAGKYQTAFPKYVVKISTDAAEDGTPEFAITVVDEMGRILESATSRQLKEEGVPSAFQAMEDLYNKASRPGRSLDRALDALLSELN